MNTTITIMLVIFFVLLFVGVPVAFSIGASAIFALLIDGGISMVVVPQRMFVQLNSFSLMAIPLFILAGELMGASGITGRIVKFASAMVGHLRASLAHITILSSMLMAGISGSASADTSDMAACVTASANTVGPIIPPSIMMVIYGSMTGASVGAMFLGGMIPGILMGLSLMVWVYFYSKKRNYVLKSKASVRERLVSAKGAIGALLMPVIILGGILSGVFTATEAGAVACIYALAFGMITGNIRMNNLYGILRNAVMGTTIPMFIIGIAAVFGWIMTRYNFPQQLAVLMEGITSDPNVFILIIMAIYFILGMFMEANAGMIIMTPIIYPIALEYGFSAVHLGVLTVIIFCIGSITPPVGLQLFIASSIAKVPLSKSAKTIWPYVFMLSIVTILCALIPQIVMLIPDLFL